MLFKLVNSDSPLSSLSSLTSCIFIYTCDTPHHHPSRTDSTTYVSTASEVITPFFPESGCSGTRNCPFSHCPSTLHAEMLPAHPPDITNGDFDPATYPINGDEDGMDVDDQEESTVDLSSTEINILIYLVCYPLSLTSAQTSCALLFIFH